MTFALRAYLRAIAAPAVVVAVALLWLPRTGPADPMLAVILVGLGVIAANHLLRVTPHYKTDAAPAIEFATVLLFPAAAAVALVGAVRLGR